MGSLGETLRQARLHRGASIADAEAETHIQRKYLEALEAEDYAALPPMVYTRGFIRNYARYLGLDPEATLDLFGPGRVREERMVIKAATPRLTPAQPVSMRLFTALAGVVLVGLLLAYLWAQYTSFAESLGQGEQPAAARTAVAPTRTAGAPSIEPAPTQPAAAVAPPTSVAPEQGIVLEARVTERTWMEVWVDGSSQLQATLQAGTARTFNATSSIRIRVGNAGGVQVTINGQPQGPLGDRFQVKEFVWER